jgi:hypothetical protein
LLGVGGPDVDFGLDIAANRFQEALVTGGFSGSVRFGGAGTLTSNGPSDLVVFKTDRTGLIVRAIRGGGPEGDSGIALATDASDNLFLAGRSAGRVTLGQGSQTLTTDGRNGDSDVLLAGFNPDLVPQFVQTAGGTAQDIGRGITVEGNGRIHISGMFNGGATFGSGAGAKTLTSQAGSDGFLARFTPATGDPVEPPPGNLTVLYMSSTTGGTIDGIRFQDEDILAFDPAQRRWTLLVDGSDIGLANTDVDAFHWASPNALFMSFNTPVNLPGIGPVDDSDVVRFVPTRLGANTTGQFQTFFNGRDAGLTTDAEDVDAFSFTPDGNLLISTLGRATVPGLNGSFQAEDEDVLQLIRRTPAAWNLLLDGSSEGLTTAEEDISAINLNEELFHLSTVGAFNALGVSGDGADALGCKPAFLAGVLKLTACSLRFDGSANGFGSETIDAFGVGETGVAGDTFSDDDGSATGDDTLDINEPETGLADQPLFLPLIVSND